MKNTILGTDVILTIVFIVLKATGVIDWSWWWVFSPIWITVLLVLFILLVVSLVLLIVSKREERKW